MPLLVFPFNVAECSTSPAHYCIWEFSVRVPAANNLTLQEDMTEAMANNSISGASARVLG